jgi:hypothetical protein
MMITATKLYERTFSDLPDAKNVVKEIRGTKSDKQYRRFCSRQIHSQLTHGIGEIPRCLNGQKLGLRKRIENAVKGGLIEIRPIGIWYL